MSREIFSHKNRQTGTEVVLIDNRDGMFDDDEFIPWVTYCVDHANYCGHETRKVAESFLPVPADWCEACAIQVYGPPTEMGC